MNIRAAVMEQRRTRRSSWARSSSTSHERDEVLVRMLATGICRSDLSYLDGKWPSPLPIVLGHEGAGVDRGGGRGGRPRRGSASGSC